MKRKTEENFNKQERGAENVFVEKEKKNKMSQERVSGIKERKGYKESKAN